VKSLYLIMLSALAALLIVSCSTSDSDDEITASLFTENELIAECDSAVETYMAEHAEDYDFAEIAAIMDSYSAKDPNSTGLMRYIQDNYFGFDKSDELTELYKSRYEADSNSAMLAYLYGRILSGRENQLRLFRRATDLDSNYYWGWYALGVTIIDEPFIDTTESIESLRKAIAIDNSQPAPFRQIGSIFKARGQNDKALTFYDLLAQTEPDNIRSLSPKISLLKKIGEFEAAESCIVAFAGTYPDDYSVENEYAELYLDQDRFQDAIPHLTRMTDLTRNPNTAFHKLMVTFCKMGQPDLAYSVLQEAMSEGFDDYRLVIHDPQLDQLRAFEGFTTMKTSIEATLDSLKNATEAERAKDREDRRKTLTEEMINRPAPDFTLTDLHGNSVRLSELKGNVAVLDLWATWCGPCRMTMPLLQAFHDDRHDDMKYYAVNVWQADTSLVRPFLSKYGYSFNNLFGSAETASDFGVKGIPTLFVIGKDGNIRYEHSGYRPDLDEILSWLLDDLTK